MHFDVELAVLAGPAIVQDSEDDLQNETGGDPIRLDLPVSIQGQIVESDVGH